MSAIERYEVASQKASAELGFSLHKTMEDTRALLGLPPAPQYSNVQPSVAEIGAWQTALKKYGITSEDLREIGHDKLEARAYYKVAF